jgi:hypothetical protein
LFDKEKLENSVAETVYSGFLWGATPGPWCVRSSIPLRRSGFVIEAAGMIRFYRGDLTDFLAKGIASKRALITLQDVCLNNDQSEQ